MAFVSQQTIAPRVIVYSHRYAAPIDLTPICAAVQAGSSTTSSTTSSATVRMLRSPEAYLVEKGDWIQIDATDQQGRYEHLFFGQIKQDAHSSSVLGEGGGARVTPTLMAVTWGAVFQAFVRDVRLALQLFGRDLAAQGEGLAGLAPGKLPTLAMLAMLLGHDDGFTVQPQRALSIVMQFLARYGGTMRQEFWLPASFANGSAIPLHWLICKLNRVRLDGSQVPLVVDNAGLSSLKYNPGAAYNYAPDDEDFNVALRMAQSLRLEDDTAESAWQLVDWAKYFDACKYYQSGYDFLNEAVEWEDSADCWTLMQEMGDLPWCELRCQLVEKIEQAPLTGIFRAHNGAEFHRNFLLSVSFKPIPHPSYKPVAASELPPRSDQAGGLLVEADTTGYDLCPKFVVNANAVTGFDFRRAVDDVFSYWMTLPRSALWAGEQYDPIGFASQTNWVIPIINNAVMSKFGHRPNETQTRFFFGKAGATALTPYLVRKTLLQYAWTNRAGGIGRGGFNLPMFSACVPRAGDVAILRGNVTGSSETLDRDPAGQLAGRQAIGGQTSLQTAVEGKGAGQMLALSVYAEQTTWTMQVSAETGVWQGSTFVAYSHGQDVEVLSDMDPIVFAGMPYHRGMSWDELRLSVRYWLPWLWDVGAELEKLPIDAPDPLDETFTQALDDLPPQTQQVVERDALPQPTQASTPKAPAAPPKRKRKPKNKVVQTKPAAAAPQAAQSDGEGPLFVSVSIMPTYDARFFSWENSQQGKDSKERLDFQKAQDLIKKLNPTGSGGASGSW